MFPDFVVCFLVAKELNIRNEILLFNGNRVKKLHEVVAVKIIQQALYTSYFKQFDLLPLASSLKEVMVKIVLNQKFKSY